MWAFRRLILTTTASEREANKEESQGILGNVRQGAEAWDPSRTILGQTKKVRIDARFKMCH